MNQDFEQLVNAPISSGYFSFKSEKNWTQLDTSKYNQLFSINVKNLSNLYNSIPFNEYMEIDDKYFTKDQLTSLISSAECAERAYKMELLQDKKCISAENMEEPITEDTMDEDLDFLLSLKVPIKKSLPGNVAIMTTSGLKTNELKMKSHPNKSESINLESWLDSVLED